MKCLKSKKNVLVLGSGKMGKTSFLMTLAEMIDEQGSIPVMLHAEKSKSINDYVRSGLLSILTSFSHVFGDNPHELMSLSLIDVDRRLSEINLSDEVKDALKLLLVYEHDPKISADDALRNLFSLPAKLTGRMNKDVIVLVDDVDLLEGMKSEQATPENILKTPDTTFVLTSTARLKLEGTDEMQLKPFTLDGIREFLGELELNEAALNTLFNLTEGHPFYLNFLARLLRMTGVKDAAGITNLLDDALDNELDVYFSERLKLLSPRELPILFCMAEHNVNTPARVSKLLDYSQTNVRRFLSIMEEKGFVMLKERGVFEIHDPIFRRWLERPRKKTM